MFKLQYLYGVFPLVIFVLLFLSRDLELPPDMEETGISRAFLKVSLFLYRRLKGRIKSASSEKIRVYLRTLEQRKDMENAETEYFIRKIGIVLIMAFAGNLLALAASLGAGSVSHFDEEGRIKRGSYGEDDYETVLIATDAAGEQVGEFEMKVGTRLFTKQEADELFERAVADLESSILGENESLDSVSCDMELGEEVDGYPFDIRWKVDNYEVMSQEGKLKEENIPEEGVVVMLTATFGYGEYSWQQVLYANVVPKVLTPGEKAVKEIKSLLSKADKETGTDESIPLPGNYEGRDLTWSEKKTDNSLILLLLTLTGAAASYVLKDKELKKSMEERHKQMLGDYSQMISSLVLYMEAGMTMRNIFGKLSSSYLREKKNGGQKRFLYEEILMTNRELSAGTSELTAYEHFGIRCGGQQYTRLSTLLTQNLKKGNRELLTLLREESNNAFQARMDRARKAGEEAGTKLLLPMILMLVIVMIIIMIPAYLAF
ncbi:MAG: hypothetical protein K6C96_05215 [Butyrivibrio sp.]|nr:hypothetical protein [Butyrivibrio sp.]